MSSRRFIPRPFKPRNTRNTGNRRERTCHAEGGSLLGSGLFLCRNSLFPCTRCIPWFARPFSVHPRDPGQIGPAGHSRGIGAGRIRPRPCGALHRNRLPLSKANGAADSRAGGELLRAATPRVAGRSPGTECSNSMSLTFSQNEITRNSFARTAPMNPESTKAATKVARKVHGQPRCERTA